MADRGATRPNPLATLLAPRSMSTAFIGILLPFLILPIIIGYIGYTGYQNSLRQAAADQLSDVAQSIDQQVAKWQSTGVERISAISQDAAVVSAASDLASAGAGTLDALSARSALLEAISRVQPSGQIFSDYAIVSPTTRQIVASTNPLWNNQTLASEELPVPNWSQPFTTIVANHPILGAQLLTGLAAAPMENSSRNSGLVLLGILQSKDLAAILQTPVTNRTADGVVLVFQDTWTVRYDTALGSLGNLESIRIQYRGRAGSADGISAEYTNSQNVPVLGNFFPLTVSKLSGTTADDPGFLQVAVERSMAAVNTPLGGTTPIAIAFLIGILTAGLLAAIQAALFIVRPTNRLAAAVNRFVAGNSEERIPQYGTSEFVSLAGSLNRMISELRDVSHLIGSGGQVSTRRVIVTAELNQTLTGVNSLDETLRTVTNLVRERLGFDFAAIYLVDEAGQFAVVREATGAAGDRLKAQGSRFPLGSYSIIGSVAQSGKSHLAANVADDPMFVRNDLLPDTRSELSIPIRMGRKVVGVLDIHSATAGIFSQEDVDLLQSIADQTGTTLQNVQVLEAAQVNLEASQQLFRTSRLISSAAKPDEIYRAALEGLKGGAYIVTILEAEEINLRIRGFFDPVNPLAEEPPAATINDAPDILSRLVPGNAPVVIKVLSELTRLPPNIRLFLENLGCRVVGFIPLRQGDRLIGALMLAARDENAITLARVRTLVPLSEQILSAMERLELLRSTQDRLTELATLNRISQSVSQAIDLQGLFEVVHEQTRTTLGDLDIVFSLYDANRDLLTFPYAFVANESVNIDPMPMGESPYGLVIRNAQPLMLSEDVENRAAAMGVRFAGTAPDSWLGVPLVTANQVVGVIALQYTQQNTRLSAEEMELMRAGMYRPSTDRTTRRFSENDMRLMTTIATQIASTIRTATLLQESERKAIQLQTAAEIARETIGLLDLDELLSHSINLIRERFGFYHSSVFLIDEERKFAVLRESTGEAGRQLKARAHKLGVGSQSIVGWVTENARPRVADDVTADPMHRPNPLLPATRSELGIPLRIGETVIGALDVQSTIPYAFAQDDITILQVIADQIAIAAENARLFSTTRDYLARHRSLYQVTTAAASSTTVDNALFSAAQGLRVTMNGARVAVFLLSPEQDALIVRAHAGFNSKEIEKMRVTLGQGVQGWVAQNKQPSLVASTATDSRYLMIDSDIQSELCVPLIHRDELLGVLDMQSPIISAFSEDDVQLLGTVASSLAAIMSSTVLFEQVTLERERLRHLYEEAIGMAGPPSGDMESLLRTSLERVRSVSGADCVSIAFPIGNDQARIEMCTCEPHFKHLSGLVAQYGQDVIGEALSGNQAVKYTPASTGTLSRSLAQAGVRAALALPLQWTGRTIGALMLSRMSSERAFSNEESQLANLLALQVAATIESARLFDQTRRQAEREHQLYEITSRIRRSVDMQGILSTTASELSKALGARRAVIKIGMIEGAESQEGNGGKPPEGETEG